MEQREPTREELFEKIRTLEERLREAEQTIEAIQNGEVDALVIQKPDGEQLYTLTGADHGYRVLVESVSEGALILSSDDSIYYCNRTLGEMLGLPIQKIIGRKLDSYVAPEGLARLMELITESRGLGAAKGEFLIQRSDGTLLPVNVSLNRMSVSDFEGVCAVITDLSEQKRVEEELRRHRTGLELLVNDRTADLQQEIIERERAEEALRKSEVQYRTLFESIDEGFCIIERLDTSTEEPIDFRYLTVNPAFATQTGLRNVQGMTIREVVPGESEGWLDIYDTVLRTGEPIRFEHDLVTMGRTLELYAFRVENETRRRVAVIFTDITERKLAQEKVRYQNTILETINQIFLKALTCETEEQLGATCLRAAEELTQSKYGFIGEFDQEGSLYDISISNPGWEACTMYDQSGHRRPPVNFKVHGLYGRVVLDGKSLLTNEPKSHPESIGTPSGHPPLTAFLGVPLIHHGMTIGIVGLANREGGYTLEHQQAIEAITPAIVEAFFRKRAETGLRESRSQLDLALRSAQMGVWHLNLIENKRHFDDQTCHLLGIDGAKFTGTDDEFYKAIHPDDREMLKAVWARTIDQGAPYEMEFRAVWPDGSVHYVLSRAKLFRNETGQRVRFNGLIWDITERKRAEEELHKAKEEAEMHAKELEALMDAVPALIWITRDTECLSMTGNRAVYEFLGMPTGANVSKTAPEAARPVHFKALRDGMEIPLDELPMQQAAKGKGTQDCELEYVFDDGTSKITLGNTTPLYDVTGQAYGAIAAFVDITQRKRMEEELRKSRDELELRVRERTAELVGTVTRLEQLNEELQEFAFIASHDLQEPLRKIQAFGSILARKHKESLDPEGQDYMERITKAANRMSELLRALLSYSRSGTSQLNYEPVSLTEVAKDAASDLEIMINRAKGSVEISALPTVDADAPLLRELFQNFIGNSIKYRKESEPPVVKIYGKVAGATCQVMIEDNGIGFDECYSHKIFKPFERLHGRNAPYTGTGMGLAICKKIVNRHGGEITVRSIPEGGTTFIVSLPIAQEKMVEWESKTLHS